MLVVGLTGGIGSGKSAVAQRFAVLGVPVIDADQLAREIVAPGREAYQPVLDYFGDDILADNGEIDRASLRRIIFSEPEKKAGLESIMHPIIKAKMQSAAQELGDMPYCVFMIPLLIEANQVDLVDKVLVVLADRSIQIERTSSRDQVEPSQVKSIIKSQATDEERMQCADDIIHNNGTLDELYAKVDELHGRYMELSGVNNENASEINEDNTLNSFSSNLKIADIPGQVSAEAMPWLYSQEVVESQSPEKDAQIYELPLNERIRVLLRLDSLFAEFERYAASESDLDSRNAVRCLISIQNTLNRPDIKTDLIKESERLKLALAKFAQLDGVDIKRLAQTQHYLTDLVKSMRAYNGTFGQQLRRNELITAVKQRETIPGGPMIFDLPVYGHWLSLPAQNRRADLKKWVQEFDLLRTAIELVLGIVRESALSRPEAAGGGTFQLVLDQKVPYQLIRVFLPKDSPYFAEMSGGRHRFGIRFVEHPDVEQRPLQVKDSVEFQLACCAI